MELESHESFKSLGDYMKYIRKMHNVTMTDLSKQAEVSQPYLSLIENNKNKPSDEIIEKLSDGLAQITDSNKKDLIRVITNARSYFSRENIKRATLEFNKQSEVNSQIARADTTLNMNYILDFFDRKRLVEENIKRRDNGEFIDPSDIFTTYKVMLDHEQMSDEEVNLIRILLLGIQKYRKE